MKDNQSTQPDVELAFTSIRHITCPEDADSNRKTYVGYVPITEIPQLSTNENVRDYLLDAEGRQRRRPTQVHRAILDTLENNPQDFAVLNGGITVVARACVIDEKKKTLTLKNASIINGAQTQGVIRDYLDKNESIWEPDKTKRAHVQLEVIVTDEEDLIGEISIARNFQNDVMLLSIAGRLHEFDELAESLAEKVPGAKLQRSETELSDDYVKTERLMQVIEALAPEELWPAEWEFNKVFTYSKKAKCLKDFRELHNAAHNPSAANHKSAKKLYQFYLDIVAQAWELYSRWKTHQGFKGTGIRAIERNGSEVVEVPDGIVFPILSAYSVFVVKASGGWEIKPPRIFSEGEFIKSVKTVYTVMGAHNPMTMGRSKACYSALYEMTSIYRRLSEQTR
jgi:hypothetical protein